MSEALNRRKKALEDQFFSQKDKVLLESLRRQMNSENEQEELARIIGINDPKVLDHLASLGLTPVTASVLAIIPLLAVAWADGEVDEKERETILKSAHEHGIESGSAAEGMLHDWLQSRPGNDLFQAWKAYVQSLSDEMSDADIAATKAATLDRARKVAQATGGVLGLGNRISRVEQKVLDDMEKAFAG
jgi:hypothetical protein